MTDRSGFSIPGEDELDSLTATLLQWSRHQGVEYPELMFEWPGLSLRGQLVDVVWPDSLDVDYGGWVVIVRQFYEDTGRLICGAQPQIGKESLVSLQDPPARVSALDGRVVWKPEESSDG